MHPSNGQPAYSTGPQTPPIPPKKGPGCFAIGCFTLIILIVVSVTGGYFWIKSLVNSYVQDFADTEPKPIPSISLSTEQIEDASLRAKAFIDNIRSGRAAPILELKGEEVNALLATDSNWEKFSKYVYLTAEENTLHGLLSVPLEELGYSGKWVTAEAQMLLHFEDGHLSVQLPMFATKGKGAHPELFNALTAEDIGNQLQDDKELRAILRKLKTIEIADGVMRVTPKQLAE